MTADNFCQQPPIIKQPLNIQHLVTILNNTILYVTPWLENKDEIAAAKILVIFPIAIDSNPSYHHLGPIHRDQFIKNLNKPRCRACAGAASCSQSGGLCAQCSGP